MPELITLSLGTDPNLQAYWRLEDDGLDQTANNNDLTLSGAGYVTGKFGKGLDFEASSSQYAYAADSASLSITGDLTISCWVNFETVPNAEQLLVGKWRNTGDDRSYMLQMGTNTTLVFYTSVDGAAQTSATVSWTPATATWYHVAVVYTAAGGTANFYVNGAAQGAQQSGLSTSISDQPSRTSLGAYSTEDGGQAFLDGILDDPAIFNRTLSAAEVFTIYSEGLANHTAYFM